MQSKDNRFADAFQDPLCKLNLKETSEFVKSFPMPGNMECRGFLEFPPQRRREGVHSMAQRRVEIPSTPGRPIINYSIGNHTKKSLPSKWEDAEKWLMSSSCHESPAHAFKPSPGSSKIQKQSDNFKHQMEEVAEKSRVTEEKVSKLVSSFQGSVALDQHNPGVTVRGFSASSDVLLKGWTFYRLKFGFYYSALSLLMLNYYPYETLFLLSSKSFSLPFDCTICLREKPIMYHLYVNILKFKLGSMNYEFMMLLLDLNNCVRVNLKSVWFSLIPEGD